MQRSDNAWAALLMVGSQVAYTVNDTFMKALSDDVPFTQAIFVRSLAVTALVALLAWRTGQLRLPAGAADRWRVLVRSVAEALTALLFISALYNMPIANATAILQVVPLTVALGAWLFLREPLGWRRLVAIGVGFLGVMLVIRPGFEGFTIWSLSALGAVFGITLRDLVTRRMSAAVPTMTIALAASVGVTLFSSIGAFSGDWTTISVTAAGQLAGATTALIAAYFLSVAVMRVGDIAFVAPFRYTSLVAALVLGFVIFREWPDALTLAGSGIVVATGLYALWREQVSLHRQR